MKASIIIPVFNPDETYDFLMEYLEENAKDHEIIPVDGKNGLANAYNQGIEKASCDIVITIHQDCVPHTIYPFKELLKPFENKDVVMTYARVYDYETKRLYSPFPPDGKLVAYRKSALQAVSYFDEKRFFTGGEDVDIWIRLKEKGLIKEALCIVTHFHKGYLGNKTIEKRKQNGNINGALFKQWGFNNPKALKSLVMCLLHPFTYGSSFWKGYSEGKQTYRRKEEMEHSDCYKYLRGKE